MSRIEKVNREDLISSIDHIWLTDLLTETIKLDDDAEVDYNANTAFKKLN